MPPDPHKEFRELCALSTTGELTTEEWRRLEEHLMHCADCRESQRQFDRIIATVIPAWAEEGGTSPENGSKPGSWSIERAEAALMESLRGAPSQMNRTSMAPSKPSRWAHTQRYAVAALILAVFTFGGYRVGVLRRDGMAPAVVTAGSKVQSAQLVSQQTTISTEAQKRSDQSNAVALHNQLRMDQLEMIRLKQTQSQLEAGIAKRSADLNTSLQDRADLEQRLKLAQTNALSLQTRLDLMHDQESQDITQTLALKAQVNDLNAALQRKDKEVAQEEELLQHDRDIRNLIGARNLYIAEIYDVAKTGDTQKPFGRVFYTKDRSLIFYGYDLDQERGVKRASAFQAWGRRGTDQQHDVSLGLLYQDDTNQNRWVLKFNDAKAIAQIDAVFVTAEPEGGSRKPSSKPLLFTYLHVDPNHP